MPVIETVTAVPTVAGFFTDDQAAIVAGAERDGFGYRGDPVTPGFDRVRMPGEALSVLLELSDGSVARGDCAAVQYSGAGGRDPVFRAADHAPVVEGPVADALVGRDAAAFGETVGVVADLEPGNDGRHPTGGIDTTDRLHAAVRYGVSQALADAAARAESTDAAARARSTDAAARAESTDAAARARSTDAGPRAGRTTKMDVLADHLGTDPATEPVPVFGQSGDARRENAEKMLLKGVDVLPHGLFNSAAKVGEAGERLRRYLEWLSGRVDDLGPEDYRPTLHVDVYGVLGELLDPPYDRPAVADVFADLRAAAAPYPLQVEGPVDAGSRPDQIRAMAELRDGLADAGVDVALVADEWCDTLADVRAFVDRDAADLVQVKTPDLGGIHRSGAAVRYARDAGVGAYLGGTCNETVTSARASAHVALATRADQVLAKPGMGFDEGFMTVTNEMRRTLALAHGE